MSNLAGVLTNMVGAIGITHIRCAILNNERIGSPVERVCAVNSKGILPCRISAYGNLRIGALLFCEVDSQQNRERKNEKRGNNNDVNAVFLDKILNF